MELNDLAKALAEAQGEMKNAVLNKVNPHFRNKYADLPAVRDAVVPILSKHGLSIVQFTSVKDGAFTLTTRLLHSSGAFIEGEFPLPNQPDKPQAIGSALTYARRYSLAAICGIASDEDDDAELGEKEIDKTPVPEKPKGTPAPKGASPELVKSNGDLKITELKARVTELGREIRACSDADELIALLGQAASIETMTLAEKHLPTWWFGVEGENNGLKNLIETTKAGFATQIAAE